MRIDFGNQDSHSAASSDLILVLLNRADNSPAVDPFTVGTSLRPTELPYVRAVLAFASYPTSSLHGDLPHPTGRCRSNVRLGVAISVSASPSQTAIGLAE